MQTLSASVVVTRKPHTCWGCLRKFPAGSMLLSESIASDGSIGNSYTCQDCYHETLSWDVHEWESTCTGNVGYWKGGVWYAHS